MLEPPIVDKQGIDDASLVITSPGLPGSLNHLLRDDGAVGSRDLALLQLAGDAFPDQVAEAQTDLGDLGGVDRRQDVLVVVRGEDFLASASTPQTPGPRD